MKKSKIIILGLLMLNIFLLSGCWNYREVENLLIVAGVAIDKGANGSGYHLTVDTVDVTEGKEKPPKSKFLETDGDTIFDAERNAVKESDKKLIWSHDKIVIISNQIASEGITPVLDMFIRNTESRNDIDIIISRENTAQDVIKPKGVANQIYSFETDKTITNDTKFLSKAPYVKLYQAIDMLFGNGIALTLPALNVTNNMGEPVTELDGTAVFKKDKLLGYLNSDESKFFLFATDQIKGGLLLVKESSPTPNISLDIKDSKTTITPICTGDKPSININIQMQCALGENETSSDYSTEDGIKKIESDAAKELEVGIKQLVAKVGAQYDSDIFGFGSSIYQDNYEYWSKIKPQWDNIFKTLNVNVTAKVEIQNSATTKSNIKVGD
jgi:spore germination protein KC